MPELVDAELLGLCELAVGSERLLLEEAPRDVAAREELVVAHPFLLLGREHRALGGRFPLVNDLDRASERGDLVAVGEVGDGQESVAFVPCHLLVAQHRGIVCPV